MAALKSSFTDPLYLNASSICSSRSMLAFSNAFASKSKSMTSFSFWMLPRRTSRTSCSSSVCSQWLKTFITKASSYCFTLLGEVGSPPLDGRAARLFSSYAVFSRVYSFSDLCRQSATTPCDPSPKILSTSICLIFLTASNC